jgi:hypothetical protein
MSPGENRRAICDVTFPTYGESDRECVSKREYVQTIYHGYRPDKRPEKWRILDEFCRVSMRSGC